MEIGGAQVQQHLLQVQPFPPKPQCLMTPPLPFKLTPPLLLRLRLTPAAFSLSAAASPTTTTTISDAEDVTALPEPPSKPKRNPRDKKSSPDANQLKLNWLDSLTCPLPDDFGNPVPEGSDRRISDPGWVIGVDPDLSGALAVLKPDTSAQVFDSPHLKVLVGKGLRKRLDVKSIIQLLRNIDAPIGTTAYIEQSIPYPQDGKQGWWSGGFGYGLWIGILVTSGYSVIPVPSLLWKNEFKLAGNRSTKDDSRELASALFPSTSSLLKRKKDHGRAEALLIAAYGKGLKANER
ncbi:hypothetical protein ACP275_14G234600 [Erythranthe tilingii]